MTNRRALEQMLGNDVVVTNPYHGMVMARGRLIALADHPTVIVQGDDDRQISLPQNFLVRPDLTVDARRVIAELERYEDQHGEHTEGWPCLQAALDSARAAVSS